MRKPTFIMELCKIKGKREFPCPKCGLIISTEDGDKEGYSIIDTVINDGFLEKIVIKCEICNSIISLEGIDIQSNEKENRTEISEPQLESRLKYRTYHTTSFDGIILGQLTVEYAQKEDIKTFKRIRKLRKGDAFKAILTLKEPKKAEYTNEDFQEISKIIKKRFKGLKSGDVYIIEVKDGKKNFLGKF
jgi:hypothetical protein